MIFLLPLPRQITILRFVSPKSVGRGERVAYPRNYKFKEHSLCIMRSYSPKLLYKWENNATLLQV